MWFRQYLCLLIIRSSVRVGNVKIRIWLETEVTRKTKILSDLPSTFCAKRQRHFKMADKRLRSDKAFFDFLNLGKQGLQDKTESNCR